MGRRRLHIVRPRLEVNAFPALLGRGDLPTLQQVGAMSDACGAMGWWGHRRYFCDLTPDHASKWHENNAENPGVTWIGDHTPPCACCPEVLPDGTFNIARCGNGQHVIPHRGCILR